TIAPLLIGHFPYPSLSWLPSSHSTTKLGSGEPPPLMRVTGPDETLVPRDSTNPPCAASTIAKPQSSSTKISARSPTPSRQESSVSSHHPIKWTNEHHALPPKLIAAAGEPTRTKPERVPISQVASSYRRAEHRAAR